MASLEQKYYCAAGVSSRSQAADGFYTGILDSNGACTDASTAQPKAKNRECVITCPPGYTCKDGLKTLDFSWQEVNGFKCDCVGTVCTGSATIDEVPDQSL